MDGVHGFTKLNILLSAKRRAILKPFVIGATGDIHEVAQELGGVVLGLGLDEGIALYLWPTK